MFVIAPLPEGLPRTRQEPVHLDRGYRFERTQHLGQRGGSEPCRGAACCALDGRGKPFPCDNKNPVDVVRHYYQSIQLSRWKPLRKPIPHCLHYSTHIAHAHLPIHHIAKQTLSVLGTYGYKIGTFAGIIESPQAKGPAAERREATWLPPEGRSKRRPYRVDLLPGSTDGKKLEHFN